MIGKYHNVRIFHPKLKAYYTILFCGFYNNIELYQAFDLENKYRLWLSPQTEQEIELCLANGSVEL